MSADKFHRTLDAALQTQAPSAERDARNGLTEPQARRSEIELMIGRISGLARRSGLTSDQRIGVCLAQKVLEGRRQELDARRVTPPAIGGSDGGL